MQWSSAKTKLRAGPTLQRGWAEPVVLFCWLKISKRQHESSAGTESVGFPLTWVTETGTCWNLDPGVTWRLDLIFCVAPQCSLYWKCNQAIHLNIVTNTFLQAVVNQESVSNRKKGIFYFDDFTWLLLFWIVVFVGFDFLTSQNEALFRYPDIFHSSCFLGVKQENISLSSWRLYWFSSAFVLIPAGDHEKCVLLQDWTVIVTRIKISARLFFPSPKAD